MKIIKLYIINIHDLIQLKIIKRIISRKCKVNRYCYKCTVTHNHFWVNTLKIKWVLIKYLKTFY